MRDFIDDFANHQPVDKDNSLVLELTNSMSRFFPNEDARAAELRDILIAIEFGKRLISIFGVKAEIGSKGAEPFAQATLYYYHSAPEMSAKFEYSNSFNFLCLIVTVFGLTFIYLPLSYILT